MAVMKIAVVVLFFLAISPCSVQGKRGRKLFKNSLDDDTYDRLVKLGGRLLKELQNADSTIFWNPLLFAKNVARITWDELKDIDLPHRDDHPFLVPSIEIVKRVSRMVLGIEDVCTGTLKIAVEGLWISGFISTSKLEYLMDLVDNFEVKSFCFHVFQQPRP